MLELNHLQVPLSGINLIEASAGTGKTYAIACLYLRLLVEQDLAPDGILVVTYTEAATKELRGRIRSRIREAHSVLSGAETDDPFLAGLRDNVNGLGPGIAAAKERLSRALIAFDTAAIHTIHGFSLRALQDNAFESGSLYDTELVTDHTPVIREIVDDFWRTHFFCEASPLLSEALRRRITPDYLVSFLKEMLAAPLVQIIPWFSAEDITALDGVCRAAFHLVTESWSNNRGEIEEIIRNDKGLSRSEKNYREDLLPPLFEGMASFTAGENPCALPTGFEKFCTGTIEQQRLKKNPPPHHPFFDLCQELNELVSDRFLALRCQLVRYGREQLPTRKRALNIRFFDDLLKDLHDALSHERGALLAASLRGKYRAALIDEFQDTDPLQYDIFKMIYAGTGAPLFLIGDPKQAIYSFRGADIFAYMKAAGDLGGNRRFSLTGNWRSTPRLLEAFNTFFTCGIRPFVFDAIAYHPVVPGKSAGEAKGDAGEAAPAPLQIWQLPPGEDGKALTVGGANDTLPGAVASGILGLLREGEEGGCPVTPGDMAVIVRNRWQASDIQNALSSRGIPSVMRSDLSIFATDEAREVAVLLAALCDPGNEAKVRAALVTDILGRSGSDIARLFENEDEWEACLEVFRVHHDLWRDRGFTVMARSLLEFERVRGRLLSHPDGARKLTNLLHCCDVIHQRAHETGEGMEALLAWFGERISAGDGAEEYQIRLETDELAVKIVTVHVSKGLEYPVIFCPYMWGGIRNSDEVVTCHDDTGMVKDFGSGRYPENRSIAQKETLAESLRLLYVAVTRAKYRCYLAAGKIVDSTGKNRPETSPLAYLLHASDLTRTAPDLVEQLAAEIKGLSGDDMAEQLRELERLSAGTIAIVPPPEGGPENCSAPFLDDAYPLICRKFSGTVADDWRVASFTSFAAHETAAAELPDRDEAGPAAGAVEIPAGRSIFTFPRGARAGIFLHEIFEKLDFAAVSDTAVDALVAQGLEKHGFEPEWQQYVSSMVRNVVECGISTPDGTFSLAGLSPGSWVTELEFFLPLSFITSEILGKYFRTWGLSAGGADLTRICTALRFRPVRGMVRGFMDMVFCHGGRYYLVDWKSNHLGYRVEDYGREALARAVEQNLYPLQYLLYTVALNNYLSLRVEGYDYEVHFGGVIYAFLRGVSPAGGEQFGFYRDLPPVAMIQELTALLVEKAGRR